MAYEWQDDGTYVWKDDATTEWGVSPSASPSPGNAWAVISGTATEVIFETDIVTGSKTIIITLHGQTWVPESY